MTGFPVHLFSWLPGKLARIPIAKTVILYSLIQKTVIIRWRKILLLLKQVSKTSGWPRLVCKKLL